jgi:hypothetical protein
MGPICRQHTLAVLVFIVLAVNCNAGAPTAAPTPETILQRLEPAHPRLLAKRTSWEKLRKSAREVPAVGKWASRVRENADGLLNSEPVRYDIPDGKRLLAVSRRVFDRVIALGAAFQLTEDAKYRERLWKELEAAAAFKDWNPSHFLDTAEMTAAFGLGYDWLYSTWSAERRAILRRAIVEKGLRPSLAFYRNHRWWAVAEHNWNQVCNGGMIVGSLAVAEDEPSLAGEIVAAAVKSVPNAMRTFAPDGAWGEGPGYWAYATSYNVLLIASLESALGTDFGLSAIAGFSKTAEFPVQVTGPLGKSFNYADASDSAPGGSQLLWLANRFQLPVAAGWYIRERMKRPTGLDLLWGWEFAAQPPPLGSLPTARYFRNREVVTMRSRWGDSNAAFVGFKGGDNRVNHGHLDLGSFVFDVGGRRWALDLGGDNYNLPGYFGKERWNYYRCRAEGHNTLVIDPGNAPDQLPTAVAKVVKFHPESGSAKAILDLSQAYPTAQGVQRGIQLLGETLLVQDEIQAKKGTSVFWFMHTSATVTAKGPTATLRLGEATLQARILSPAGAVFAVSPAEPLPTSPKPERQQLAGPGFHEAVGSVSKLAVRIESTGSITLAIALIHDPKAPVPAVKPLAKW